ncbi:hypothetical protein GIB67_011350 [Kingdonia uniflora]|uniref:CYTH domain-containing protein n=1 Tax=Kingdonia uniflora TaxID=39325 RepID=A0A7J7LCD4_9MAGN|nr:hypothetical protein GIB67_011350 [Kingdonia uniflora]
MEVEVKLHLPNSATHQKLSDLLTPFHIKTHLQENIFFDGSATELSSKRAVLRLRFYDNDSRCVVSLKAKAVLVDGVSRVEEDEEEIDPIVGRASVAEPWRLGGIRDSRIVKRAKEEFGVGDNGFVCLGGFRNVRAVYDWKGLKLELDETKYDFGTSYEIECESADPEGVKVLLEEFLKENGVDYSYSEVSKFSVFRSGKLPYCKTTLDARYCHFDCSHLYGNEVEVGKALTEAFESGGINREDVFLTSKPYYIILTNSLERIENTVRVSLKSLGFSYLDLYLVHWSESSAFSDATNPPWKSASKYRQFSNRLKPTWKAMEALVESGLVCLFSNGLLVNSSEDFFSGSDPFQAVLEVVDDIEYNSSWFSYVSELIMGLRP